ncbi:tRNA 2-thiouridine(34) synthase MnmA [bacterium (Candidatus Gribaldobacteria) CG10_big_fil_rev_8_21_14_0_10_37_21]|uniref:tRNA-specific 2-thiouridylase MnmA n=1 Tax=bacterium (Candidatus Gribaldobacteria) CG10_big_fil_rev_8_21_14_0_10_37_21 TaxID=2014275 RepID=A0A2H0UV93_9BACT|nr:MAG: tRNA 2-thiouridine(34) synthase MnmA [Parcubacteria group bacterium CG1_02_37_13]PIR90723.1 MAG: tRNA 2-thiouridine(34) synthase MnmA [bacterium (Candidatus Gribaldobacteria) CG10_big_fil_rev_8_21_14_0_10_37_21]
MKKNTLSQRQPQRKIKVIVAMSGGVDSSVTAALLQRAGFDLVGVFMKLWNEGSRCCSLEDVQRARLTAEKLKIPFYVLNCQKEFKRKVVSYFLNELKAGRTPNPCVLCNKEIKFKLLFKKMEELKADFVATGHYAKIKSQKSKIFQLLRAKDIKKDQSYFLWKLNQKEFAKVIFPLGNLTKVEVRQMAKKMGLPAANAIESQEICFIEKDLNAFLKKELKPRPGEIIDLKGRALGQHQGLWFYTIGQRKGLPLQQGPWFVIKKDFKKNILIVSKNEKDLLQKEIYFKEANWLNKPVSFPFKAKAKIRSTAPLAECLVFKNKAVFLKPQKAVTLGQSIVFYKGNCLLGGGIIIK